MKIKRLTAIIAIIVLAFALLSGCKKTEKPAGGSETGTKLPESVRIGVQDLVTPEVIARYEKIFEQYMGCKVEIMQFDSGADVNRAFASKSIDIGMMGTAPASIGIATDLGYEVFWIYDILGAQESLAVKTTSEIHTLEDLAGKRVATPFASTSHFCLMNALKLKGIDPQSVTIYDMKPDDIYAAWVRGDIDAAYVWEPTLSKLYEEGGEPLITCEDLAKDGIIVADVGLVNKEFAAKYPDVITGYTKAMQYAVGIFNGDQAKAVKEIAAAYDITEETVEYQFKGFSVLSPEEMLTDAYFGSGNAKGKLADILKQTADFLAEQGSIESSPDLSVFQQNITGEYIEKVLNG